MNTQTKFQFKDKVAFVTGGSTGIGRATALAFAESGATVIVADVNDDAGTQTVRMIEKIGGSSVFIKCNVADPADVKAAIDKTVSLYGRLDFAFNNAGIEGTSASTVDCSEENWQKVIDINLKGVWLCMKYQIPQMIKQGGGSIVNCASIAGVVGFMGSPAYVASKHGIVGLTKTAALEFVKSNVRINAVCPGVIQTPMIDRFIEGNAEAQGLLTAGEPIGRVGQPNEIASAVLWLCTEGAAFVVGHPMVIDGGWVAQ